MNFGFSNSNSISLATIPSYLSFFSLFEYPEEKKNMCTKWTITSPERWRLRNWVSTLCGCRFPLDEEGAEGACSSMPQASSGAMVMDSGNYSTRTSRCNQSREVMHNPKRSRGSREENGGSGSGSVGDDSSWPRFADEDYIVFCFGEDGTFDVVKGGKGGGASDQSNSMTRESRSSSRAVNRKLQYGENDGEQKCSPTHRDHDCSGCKIGCLTCEDKEGEEEGSVYLDAGSPPDETQGGDDIEGSSIIESSSSNQSNDSASSFAFPVLRFEGIGSPVQMPRSEELASRKHKGRGLVFQCCRF